MAGGILSAKDEAFCRLYVERDHATDAYNGSRPGQRNDNTARKNACILLKKPEIQARLAELRAIGAEKTGDSIATMAAQLDEDRKFARELNNPSAAVSATVAKAKLLGFYVEKKDVQIGMRPGEAQQIIAAFTERYVKSSR